jgi:ATP synthase F1 complex assembly factor 2
VFAVAHVSDASRSALRRHLLVYNLWSLIGYTYCVDALKSVVLSMALIAGRLDTQTAVRLATLEQL